MIVRAVHQPTDQIFACPGSKISKEKDKHDGLRNYATDKWTNPVFLSCSRTNNKYNLFLYFIYNDPLNSEPVRFVLVGWPGYITCVFYSYAD